MESKCLPSLLKTTQATFLFSRIYRVNSKTLKICHVYLNNNTDIDRPLANNKRVRSLQMLYHSRKRRIYSCPCVIKSYVMEKRQRVFVISLGNFGIN